MRRLAPTCLALAMFAGSACAQDLQWHGHVDLRAVVAGDEQDWSDGGLGKARFGGDDADIGSGSAVLAGTWQLTPELLASAQLQFHPEQRRELDVLDASIRYRPVSTTPWRWSLRAGAFFPPISLENDGVGWTSLRTLTPSAINSWVGEELRTIGTELQVEHRGATGTLQAHAAVFGWNDPAGEILAARGWSLGDLTSGLGAVLREPDVYAPRAFAPVPMLYRPFREIDDRFGWYAGLDWDAPTGKLALLYYDNRADPASFERYAGHNTFSWRTRFWSAGAQTQIGDVVLVAQAMLGDTAFEPVPGLLLTTDLRGGYVLAGWERDRWQPAVRVDLFSLRQDAAVDPLSEHGNAVTVALNWRPLDHVRVTGEWLRIDSTRSQRALAGLAARQVEQQLQLGVRLLF